MSERTSETVHVFVVIGTRPEAIKLAPVVRELQSDQRFVVTVCAAAQHRQMLDQVFDIFGLVPDVDLDLMRPNQSLAELTARAVRELDQAMVAARPDWVVVQGDTTTVLAAALAAFYRQIPVAHVEAGLRTEDLMAPFPEEANRRLASVVTRLHLAPTQWAADNLLHEGVEQDRVLVTGNTVVDALHWATEIIDTRGVDQFEELAGVPTDRPYVLMTGHRRENHGDGFDRICQAIEQISARNPDTNIIYPVHLNPNVNDPVRSRLGKLDNVVLTPPMTYLPFVHLLRNAQLVLTDSGGVQEEAPSFGTRVLIMRDKTERPEGVNAGIARLVGTDVDKIVSGVQELLDQGDHCAIENPYGDGKASRRIAQALAS